MTQTLLTIALICSFGILGKPFESLFIYEFIIIIIDNGGHIIRIGIKKLELRAMD